jgi:hypothetical protein
VSLSEKHQATIVDQNSKIRTSRSMSTLSSNLNKETNELNANKILKQTKPIDVDGRLKDLSDKFEKRSKSAISRNLPRKPMSFLSFKSSGKNDTITKNNSGIALIMDRALIEEKKKIEIFKKELVASKRIEESKKYFIFL